MLHCLSSHPHLLAAVIIVEAATLALLIISISFTPRIKE